MPSFHEICRHGSVLVIDAASAKIQLGLLSAESLPKWATSTEEAGIGIFQCVTELRIDLLRVDGFAYCEGPGSILGIRTAAMALRTWCMLRPRPVYAYNSLALVAHAIGDAGIGVIADARRDLWHHYQLGQGLRRIPAGELSGAQVRPEGFRHWSPLPAGVGATSYTLAELLPKIAHTELLRLAEAPDAFLHEEPSYLTWTPQIHRATDRGEGRPV